VCLKEKKKKRVSLFKKNTNVVEQKMILRSNAPTPTLGNSGV